MATPVQFSDIDNHFYIMARLVKNDPLYFARQAEDIKQRTQIKWYSVALIVTGVVLAIVGGSFGVTGLLQSHGLINLPSSWLTQGFAIMGNTPHFWSLYVIAIGSVLISGALILYNSIRIHQARQEREQGLAALAQEEETYHQKTTFLDGQFSSENAKKLAVDPNHLSFKKPDKYHLFQRDHASPLDGMITTPIAKQYLVKKIGEEYVATPLMSRAEREIIGKYLDIIL